jgi:hypothetical protein
MKGYFTIYGARRVTQNPDRLARSLSFFGIDFPTRSTVVLLCCSYRRLAPTEIKAKELKESKHNHFQQQTL